MIGYYDLLNTTSSILALVSICQLGAGLFLHFYIIKVFGVGDFTDAFIAAQTIPAILSTVIIAVFQSVYLPSLSIKAKFQRRWHIETSKAHSKLFIIFAFATVLLVLFSQIWISVIFTGFNSQKIVTTQIFLLFFMLSSWLSVHNQIAIISLRTINKFVLADLSILGGSIINVLIIYLWLDSNNPYLLGFSFVASNFVVSLILYRLSKAPKLLLKNIFYNNKNWAMMIPLFKANILYKTSPLVDRYLLSQSYSGAMTLYNLSNLVHSSMLKILEKIFIVQYLPTVSILAKNNDEQLLKLYQKLTIKFVLLNIFVTFGISIIYRYFGNVFTLLFHLSERDSKTICVTIIALSAMLFPSLIAVVINNIYYSYGNTTTVSRVGMINYVIFIPVKFISFYMYGLVGLALATTTFFYVQYFFINYFIFKYGYMTAIPKKEFVDG